MICNKKAYEDLSKDCFGCQHYADCVNDGKFVGVATMPLSQEVAQPTFIPHDYRDIKIGDGMNITIDLKEIERKLAERFSPTRQMFEYGV